MPAKKPRGRGRRFGEGQPTNRGGRPKGLMQFVREQTNDGREVADFMLQVFRGEKIKRSVADLGEVELSPSLEERIDAAKWLADRGFGKPTQTLGVEPDQPVGVIVLPPEDM